MKMSEDDKCVLCVGLLCLDIIAYVENFPEEDSDQRCAQQIWQRGGNASNSCSVLSLLGAKTELLATIANSFEKGFLKDDLLKYGISDQLLIEHNATQHPTALVIINQQNGSRTILFYPHKLPDLTFHDFLTVDLLSNNYGWIHIETRRNVETLIQILSYIDKHNDTRHPKDKIKTSVEIEKMFASAEQLYDKADYVFVSKDQARHQGFHEMETAALNLIKRCRKGATLIVPWGERGAAAIVEGSENLLTVPAYTPEKIVDTLGAGDTFIGASIFGLSHSWTLAEAIDFGCQVAGAKCGMVGNLALKGKFGTTAYKK